VRLDRGGHGEQHKLLIEVDVVDLTEIEIPLALSADHRSSPATVGDMRFSINAQRPTRRSGQALLVWGCWWCSEPTASLTGVGPLLDRVQAESGAGSGVAGLLNTVAIASVRGNISDGSATAGRWQPSGSSGRARGADARIAIRWAPTAISLFAGTVLIGAGIAWAT